MDPFCDNIYMNSDREGIYMKVFHYWSICRFWAFSPFIYKFRYGLGVGRTEQLTAPGMGMSIVSSTICGIECREYQTNVFGYFPQIHSPLPGVRKA